MSTVASEVGRKFKGARRGNMERPSLSTEQRAERREFRADRREQRAERRETRGGRENFENESSDWLWGTVLLVVILFVLSPGVLLTLPPGAGGVWMSGKTSVAAAFVHALLIAVIFNYI